MLPESWLILPTERSVTRIRTAQAFGSRAAFAVLALKSGEQNMQEQLAAGYRGLTVLWLNSASQ